MRTDEQAKTNPLPISVGTKCLTYVVCALTVCIQFSTGDTIAEPSAHSGSFQDRFDTAIPDSVKFLVERDRMYRVTGRDLDRVFGQAGQRSEVQTTLGPELYGLDKGKSEGPILSEFNPIWPDANSLSVKSIHGAEACIEVLSDGNRESLLVNGQRRITLQGGRKYRLSYRVFCAEQRDHFAAWLVSDLSHSVTGYEVIAREAYAVNQAGKWTLVEYDVPLPDVGEHTCRVRIGHSDKRPITWYAKDFSLREIREDTVMKPYRAKSTAERALSLASLRADRLNLYHQGETVPIALQGVLPDGAIGPDTTITFWGTFPRGIETRRDLLAKADAYVLRFDSDAPPHRYQMVDRAESTGDADAEIMHELYRTIHIETNSLLQHYQHYRGAPTDRVMWTEFRAPPAGSVHTVEFDPIHDLARAEHTVQLRVALWGKSDLRKVAPDHRWRIALNGADLGEGQWDGNARLLFEKAVSSSTIRSDTPNALTFRNLFDDGTLDAVSLDWIELDYVARLRPRDDFVEYKIPHDRTVSSVDIAADFSAAPVSIFAENGLILRPQVKHEGEKASLVLACTRDDRGRVFRAVGPAGFRQPERMMLGYSSSLRAAKEPPAYLLIAHRTFIEALAPLVAHRESQGLTTLVVDVEDIYDEYSHGRFSPEAIRRFVGELLDRSTETGARLRYVFLVGDATFDYQNIQGGTLNLVPTHHATEGGYNPDSSPTFAYDDYFALGSPDGTAPVVPVGRLPANSIATVEHYVSKVLEYENAHMIETDAAWRNRAVLMASVEYVTYCKLLEKDLGSAWDYKKHFGQGTAEAAIGLQSSIVQSFSSGCRIVYFAGHGGGGVWGTGRLGNKTALFSNRHVQQLSNQRAYPIVFTSTCFSGLFDTPPLYYQADTGVGVALVEAEGKGAIALVGHVGKTTVQGAHAFISKVVSELGREDCSRLGDAFLAAKRAISRRDVPGMALIGDPALVVGADFHIGDIN